MAPESMVHALEQIHALLSPGGTLIDFHPTGEPVEFLFPLEGQSRLIGYLQESDDYIEYRQADEALETSVSKGLFRVEQTEEFEFRTYADSFNELKDYLEKNWSDAVIPEEVAASAHKLRDEFGKCEVWVCEQGKINRLLAL